MAEYMTDDITKARANITKAHKYGYYEGRSGAKLERLLGCLVPHWQALANYAPMLDCQLQDAIFKASPRMPKELINTGPAVAGSARKGYLESRTWSK